MTPEFKTVPASDLLTKLSFTHLVEVLRIESAEKRAFYEEQCIRGTWSVRELKRQIASLLYERSELSIDKQKLAQQTDAGAETDSPRLTIRDPYVFEFLGLRAADVMGESDLEDKLLDKLQTLLLEMGEGFCFESRQKADSNWRRILLRRFGVLSPDLEVPCVGRLKTRSVQPPEHRTVEYVRRLVRQERTN